VDYKRFRIPNRDVKISEIEGRVTRTRVFQRLFYLKQLGLAYLVYPCATHTRAGHSIECLDEANKLLESIGIKDDHVDWQDVRLAALLHDIGHVPFSHTLEDENSVLHGHDKAERVDRVMSNLKAELPEKDGDAIDRAKLILLSIASNIENSKDWKSDLVGNTVCADLLAYITTDAAWTGIEKRPGYYRIYEYFKKAEKKMDGGKVAERLCIRLTKGGLRTDIVSAILDLLDMRYALTERVIFHHAKAIASGMLARASRLVNLADEPRLLEIGDEAFLDLLGEKAKAPALKESGPAAVMLLDGLRSRRLYKRIFKVNPQTMTEWDRANSRTESDKFCAKWRDPQIVETMLKRVEDRFDIPRGTLVLWCPEAKSGMKLVRANVTWEQGGGWHDPVWLRDNEVKQQFPGVHDRVMTIEKQYLDLWTLWIGLHPDYLQNAPALISTLKDELQIDCDPVFIETYAKVRLPGFAKAAKTFTTLQDTLRDGYIPGISNRLASIAARDGAEVDSTVVDEAIHALADEKKKKTVPKQEKRSQEQLKLFPPDQQQNEHKK
jgi:HD superfamily phosphohydrolase